MGTRILITYSSKTPTVDLIMRIMTAFSKRYEVALRKIESGQIAKEDIQWADCILLVRPYDISCTDIAKAARADGKFIAVYLDDDMLNIPDLYTGPRQVIAKVLKKKNQEALRSCLTESDLLWGSNTLLLKNYKKYVAGKRIFRSDVTADISWMRAPVEVTGKTRILFAGAADHVGLLNKYIIPALNKAAKSFPDLEITCIGIGEKQLSPCEIRIECVPWITDYKKYRNLVENGRYHIGIAVIENEAFYRCKYYNKFIEYSLLGAVGIYSNCEPYSLIVEHGKNGFLVEASVDSWAEAVVYAAEHPQICIECVENAQRLIRERFSEDTILKEIVKGIPEFSNYRSDERKQVRYHRRRFWYAMRKIGMALVERYEAHRSKRKWK